MEWLKWARYVDPEAIFYLIIAVAMTGNGIYFLMKKKKILARGIAVKGEVISLKYRLGRFAINKEPRVRFVTQKGRTIESNISKGMLSEYEKGMEVTVIYDSNKPTDFIIDGEGDSIIIPGICFIGGIVFIIIAIRQFLSAGYQ